MLYFKRNLPGWERFLRIAAGIAVAVLAVYFAQLPIGMWVGIAGGVMFAATGLVGFCPMCAMVGRKPVG
jgi:uncharacterized protein YqfA (UPF0365 family)